MSVDTPFLEPKTGLACSELSDINNTRGRLLIETAAHYTPKFALQPSENVSLLHQPAFQYGGKNEAQAPRD